MERYQVQKWRVEKAIYNKKTRKLYCRSCQKEISGREYNRGEGLCDQCVAKSLISKFHTEEAQDSKSKSILPR